MKSIDRDPLMHLDRLTIFNKAGPGYQRSGLDMHDIIVGFWLRNLLIKYLVLLIFSDYFGLFCQFNTWKELVLYFPYMLLSWGKFIMKLPSTSYRKP